MNSYFKDFFYELSTITSLIKATAAKKEIEILAEKYGLDKATVAQGVIDLPKIFGPFDNLNKELKQQLLALSSNYFEEKKFQSNSTLRIVARGALYRLCVKTIKSGWNVRKKNLFLSRVLIFLGRKGVKLLEGVAEKSLALSFRAGLYEAPILSMLYRYCQLEPNALVDEYVKNIPANPSSCPVFKIKGSNSRACALIGMDFLPSNGNLYFIESNFTPGHYIERHLLSSNGDPVCRSLMDYAEEKGLKNIIYYPSGLQRYFKADVESAWLGMAHDKGLRIEIVDDAFLGSPLSRMISYDLNYLGENTLYVTSRYFDNPLSNYIIRKGMMEKIIFDYNGRIDDGEIIYLPETLDKNDFLKTTSADDRFPNIIVKNKYIDQARGIHLFKTNSVPEIAHNDDYILCQYVIPDTIKKDDHGVIKEYVHLFRTYLLITPDGPVYAGCRKDVSGTPIPEILAEGEVSDIAPYITNLTTAGDYCVAHTEEEDRLCKKETLKVGKMLHQFLTEKYDFKN